MTNTSSDNRAPGGKVASASDGEEIAAREGADIQMAAASEPVQPSDDATLAAEPLDDEASYPSAMTGTTNANAHTAGAAEGHTDSIRNEQ